MREERFVVYGVPSPQAGTKAVPIRNKAGALVGTRHVTEGGVGLKTWRAECAAAAKTAASRLGMFPGPVEVQVQFRFAMGTSRPRWAHKQRWLIRVVGPDLDKLQRALGDSLKAGGLLRDDAQIVRWYADKYEVADAWTGAAVRVIALDEHREWGEMRLTPWREGES